MSVFEEFKTEEGVYNVDDPGTLLLEYICIALGLVGGLFAIGLITVEILGGLACLVASGAWVWWHYRKIQLQNTGITVDSINKVITVPRGLKSENWTKEFSLDFQLKANGYRATEIPFDSIQAVKWSNSSDFQKSLLTNKGEYVKSYYLNIDFAGGTVVLYMKERKRDALKTILEEVLDLQSSRTSE